MWAFGCVVLVYKNQINYSLRKSCVWSILKIIFKAMTGNKRCQHLEIFQKIFSKGSSVALVLEPEISPRIMS